MEPDRAIHCLVTGKDKFGRWVGEIYDTANELKLSDLLLSSGHAVPYIK